MDQIWQQFLATPPVTRTFFGAALLMGAADTLGLLSRQEVAFLTPKLLAGDLWRILSLVYNGNLGTSIVALVDAMRASALLESSYYDNSLHYGVVLSIILASIAVLTSFANIRLPGPAVLQAIDYLYARRFSDNIFLVPLTRSYLPFIILLVTACYTPEQLPIHFMGTAVAHIIFYIEDVLPKSSGIKLLKFSKGRATVDLDGAEAHAAAEAHVAAGAHANEARGVAEDAAEDDAEDENANAGAAGNGNIANA